MLSVSYLFLLHVFLLRRDMIDIGDSGAIKVITQADVHRERTVNAVKERNSGTADHSRPLTPMEPLDQMYVVPRPRRRDRKSKATKVSVLFI